MDGVLGEVLINDVALLPANVGERLAGVLLHTTHARGGVHSPGCGRTEDKLFRTLGDLIVAARQVGVCPCLGDMSVGFNALDRNEGEFVSKLVRAWRRSETRITSKRRTRQAKIVGLGHDARCAVELRAAMNKVEPRVGAACLSVLGALERRIAHINFETGLEMMELIETSSAARALAVQQRSELPETYAESLVKGAFWNASLRGGDLAELRKNTYEEALCANLAFDGHADTYDIDTEIERLLSVVEHSARSDGMKNTRWCLVGGGANFNAWLEAACVLMRGVWTERGWFAPLPVVVIAMAKAEGYLYLEEGSLQDSLALDSWDKSSQTLVVERVGNGFSLRRAMEDVVKLRPHLPL